MFLLQIEISEIAGTGLTQFLGLAWTFRFFSAILRRLNALSWTVFLPSWRFCYKTPLINKRERFVLENYVHFLNWQRISTFYAVRYRRH